MRRLIILVLIIVVQSNNVAASDWIRYQSSDSMNFLMKNGDDIWCLTESDIVRYNTVEGTYHVMKYWREDFNLHERRIFFIFTAPDGTLWIGTDTALFHYDNGEMVTYEEIEGVHSIIFDHNDTMWIGANQGVTEYDGEHWKIHYGIHSFRSADVAPDSTLWFGSAGGIYSYKDGKWTHYTEDDGLSQNYIYSIAVGSDGEVWAGGPKGLYKKNGETWDNSIPDGYYSKPQVYHIATDSRGDVWFTDGSCAYKLGEDVEPFLYEGPVNVHDILIDENNIVWFGTNQGLYSYDGESVTFHEKEKSLLGFHVGGVAVSPDGYVYAGAYPNGYGSGISKFDGKNWETIALNFSGQSIQLMKFGPNGDLWVGSGGLWKYDGKSWVSIPGPPSNSIYDMEFAPDGTIWIATLKGPAQYDGERWISYGLDDGLTTIEVLGIAIAPDGSVLAGTYKGGICKFNGNSWERLANCHETMDSSISELDFTQDGTLWVSAYNGIFKYTDGVWKMISGIGRSKVMEVRNGNEIWIGTDGGIVKIVDDKVTIHPTPWRPRKVTSIAFGHDDSVWVGMYDGLYRYTGDYASVVQNKENNETVINTIIHPNPFNSSTFIDFSIHEAAQVTLSVYNLIGQEVVLLLDEFVKPGHHSVKWDASGYPTGIYISRLRVDTVVKTSKMLLVK